MRKFLSISLLFIFCYGTLVPGQAQEELTRVPILWKHYQLHKTQSSETSFSQYLELHYGEGFMQHRSAHDHSKLPMKSSDNQWHAPPMVDLPALASVPFPSMPCGNNVPVYFDQTYSFIGLKDIWQPPKSC